MTAGIALVILAIARPEDPAPGGRDRTSAFVGALAVLAALGVTVLVVQARHLITLHLWSRSVTAAAVFPLALAGALAFSGRRGLRYLSAPIAAIGLTMMLAGFPAFLDAFSDDPLVAAADPPRWKQLPSEPFAEFALEFPVADLRLSPHARRLAVVAVSETDDAGEPSRFHVGTPGGRLVPIDASDLIFLDDERMLTLVPRAGGFDLRCAKADAPDDTIWQHHVSGLVGSHLSVGRDGQTWRLVGHEPSGRLVHVEGRIGGDQSAERRWTSEAVRGALSSATSSGASSIVVQTRYDSTGPPFGLWQIALSMPVLATESTFWAVDRDRAVKVGVSRLEVCCVSEQRGVERLACISFDGTRSRVFSIDPRTRRLAPVVQLPGRFYSLARLASGWLMGWTMEGPMAIRLDTGEGFRFALNPQRAWSQLAAAEGAIGALLHDDGTSTVRLYALE